MAVDKAVRGKRGRVCSFLTVRGQSIGPRTRCRGDCLLISPVSGSQPDANASWRSSYKLSSRGKDKYRGRRRKTPSKVAWAILLVHIATANTLFEFGCSFSLGFGYSLWPASTSTIMSLDSFSPNSTLAAAAGPNQQSTPAKLTIVFGVLATLIALASLGITAYSLLRCVKPRVQNPDIEMPAVESEAHGRRPWLNTNPRGNAVWDTAASVASTTNVLPPAYIRF